jgi:peptide-methionine (R)-S-oxide reductase
MSEKVQKTNAEWQAELSPEEYRVLRMKGTDSPFSGPYTDLEADGVYRCAACGNEVFSSETKFHSGSGWPSFDAPLDKNAVAVNTDREHGMVRTEVVCSQCEGHLGHVFPDGPRETTGMRYCINSTALKFDPEAKK